MWTVKLIENPHEVKRGFVIVVATFQQGNDRFIFKRRIKIDGSENDAFVRDALAAKARADKKETDTSALAAAIENGLNVMDARWQ